MTTTGLPSHLNESWAKGQLIWTYEYGLEPHPAAIRNDNGAVLMRLWRAQNASIYPITDLIRRASARELRGQFGPQWFERVGVRPDTERELARLKSDPMDAELGYMKAVLRHVSIRDGDVWREALDVAHSVRTHLAHYRPVEAHDSARVVSHGRRLGSSMLEA